MGASRLCFHEQPHSYNEMLSTTSCPDSLDPLITLSDRHVGNTQYQIEDMTNITKLMRCMLSIYTGAVFQ